MLKSIIIDDEIKAINALAWELEKFKHDIVIKKSFTEPEEAIDYMKNHSIDCVFLDIHLKATSGFHLIEKIENPKPLIVITTAYNDYGIRALKNDVIDYLLKPVDADDLKITIEKIKLKLSKQNSKSINTGIKQTSKINFQVEGKIIFLTPNEINYIKSDGNYTTLFLHDNRKILLSKKLKEIDSILKPYEVFFRIHNSYTININKIVSFLKNENYVELEKSVRLPVSRLKKVDFLNKIL